MPSRQVSTALLSFPAVRDRAPHLHGPRPSSASPLRALAMEKESLEIQCVGYHVSSALAPCGETPGWEVNLRPSIAFCPDLLRGFREREEYFHQCQTPGNETIFRDYVGGEPNT